MGKVLGKLKKVDLREVWKHEALEFTTWLAQEENLSLLSDELGFEINLLQTEAKVGKFSIDILAEEGHTGRKIIIENQLERTNHDHLGKLITYASGHDATIIIWIVKEVREEHRRAIDWLNAHTDEELNFFAIKLELWQIEESLFAPKFDVIARPNDWAKAVKKFTQGELSETRAMQLEFWNNFKDFAEENKSKLRLKKTYPDSWYEMSFGHSEAHISLTMDRQSNILWCGIIIPNSKELYAELLKHKDQIEKELGTKLEWEELEGRKKNKIKLSRDGDLDDADEWNEYFAWFVNNAESFQKVFGKYIQKLK